MPIPPLNDALYKPTAICIRQLLIKQRMQNFCYLHLILNSPFYEEWETSVCLHQRPRPIKSGASPFYIYLDNSLWVSLSKSLFLMVSFLSKVCLPLHKPIVTLTKFPSKYTFKGIKV